MIEIESKKVPHSFRNRHLRNSGSVSFSTSTPTPPSGGGVDMDVLKVDDVRLSSDNNVFSSLRTLAEILSRIIKSGDTTTEPSDENTLSALRINTAIDTLRDESLSKAHPDETAFLLKALGGLIVNNGLDVIGGISTDTLTSATATTQILNVLNKLIGADADFSGNVQVGKNITTLNLLVKELADIYDLNVSHVATLMGTIVKEYVSSESFVSGFGGSGMKIYKALSGDWNLEIDNLTVRKVFSVFELMVQKITHQGGMIIRSAAGAKLTKVTDGGSYWKCEHDSTDDFVQGDQIICQSFTGTAIKRYWRLVTSSGAGYFNLSKADCEEGSGTPEVGDEVAVLGNRTVSARQKAQIDCAVGDTAPYRDDYDNINSYSLVDKLITRTGNLSGITDAVFGVLSGSGLYGTNVYLRGTFILKSGKKIEEAIADVENNLGARITTVETNFEIREGQISSKVTEVTIAAGNAKQSETNASGSAASAGTSATNAAKSASDALGAATNAGKILEEVTIKESSITQTAGQIATKVTEVNKKVTEAETAASNAKKSETNASSSANTSSTKAGEAASSATNAGNSASSASGSAGTATAKAGEAASSATNAKKSADDAAAKLVTITEKESSIDQTARGITLQVKEVQTKATEAAGSAGTASTKAGEAATSASNAKASENAAASLVTNADGKFVTKTVYESRIKALSDSIELKVAKTEFNELGVRVSSAESSITQNAREISLKVSASEAGSIADSKVGALKGDLQATGIDIANRKITVTADTFQVQDNYGNAIAVFKTDAAGKPVIKAENIDTKNLVVESGAIIGGFKVNGYNLSNRDNSDCWVNIDYKSGNVRRISSLGNNLPDTAGATTAGYFSSDNDYTNNALVLRAAGASSTEWMGGKSNFAINALGGCKWKMNAGDHWCMPGVLWAGLFNCNNWTPSLEKSWGNGCSVRLASRDRAGVYRFSHDLGHNDYHIQAMHSAQVREDWNWWTLTTAFLNIDSSGFSLMFRRIDGAEVDPLQFQIVVFGRTKK